MNKHLCCLITNIIGMKKTDWWWKHTWSEVLSWLPLSESARRSFCSPLGCSRSETFACLCFLPLKPCPGQRTDTLRLSSCFHSWRTPVFLKHESSQVLLGKEMQVGRWCVPCDYTCTVRGSGLYINRWVVSMGGKLEFIGCLWWFQLLKVEKNPVIVLDFFFGKIQCVILRRNGSQTKTNECPDHMRKWRYFFLTHDLTKCPSNNPT